MTAVLNGKAASRRRALSTIPPVGDGGPRGLGCDGRQQRAEAAACGPTQVPLHFLTVCTSDGSYDTALTAVASGHVAS